MIQLSSLVGLKGVRHGFFTRIGGVSAGLYDSKNCGFGSGDDADNVARNRARCVAEMAEGSARLVTAFQIHSAETLIVEQPWRREDSPSVDALVTAMPGIAVGVLTADCAPVLLCDGENGVVGAAHAGWKGAIGGILESAVAAMEELGASRPSIRAAVGPCIAQSSYEVGPEFLKRFVTEDADNAAFFRDGERPDHPHFDLKGYVARRLERLGLGGLEVASHDTVAEEDRFFSYRRATRRGEPDYGRNLSAIALE
ncbi:MAG: peptidoglycan editing factor PgeF [Inquilinus sp.]|nr:peptidoglycan editing factor PgeF [Inquilinus sp.]